MTQLHKKMTIEAFEQGYFYATELTAFAQSLGLDVKGLRKNEVELHIKAYLSGNKHADLPKQIKNRKNKGSRDILSTSSQVTNYVSDRATKSFLRDEIKKCHPQLKDKSGQWYWLNDWRKQQRLHHKKSPIKI